MAWTHTLSRFEEQNASLRDVVCAIKEAPCTEEIDSGQQNGTVFATCTEDMPKRNCNRCPTRWVIKLSKCLFDAQRPNSLVLAHEAEVHKVVFERLQALSLKDITNPYVRHVVQYINHYNILGSHGIPSNTMIITKYVPFVKYKTMRDFVRSSECTPSTLLILILQIFCTLHAIECVVPHFVHMDLTLSQVFLCAWPTEMYPGGEYLPLDSTHGYQIPKANYWPVLGDFGTSSWKQNFAANETYSFQKHGPMFVHRFQDIFRFFLDLYTQTEKRSTHKFVKQLIHNMFDIPFQTLINEAVSYNMCMYVGSHVVKTFHHRFESFADVLRYIPEVSKFKTH
jgi:hypothetical protein